jgi:hypothetical protein
MRSGRIPIGHIIPQTSGIVLSECGVHLQWLDHVYVLQIHYDQVLD